MELKHLLAQWLNKRACTKRELQSLVGKLQHASSVVRRGRTFLRRFLFFLLYFLTRWQDLEGDITIFVYLAAANRILLSG